MALNVVTLQQGLIKWMMVPAPDTLSPANSFMTAYELYAKGAMATSGGKLTVYNKPAAVAAMASILPPDGGAIKMAQAIAAFWLGALVPPSLIVTGIIVPALAASIKAITSNIYEPIPAKAGRLANVIHIATIGITTVNPAGPTPGTII